MDVDAWNSLVVDAQAKGIDATRPVFERVLKALPTAVCVASYAGAGLTLWCRCATGRCTSNKSSK